MALKPLPKVTMKRLPKVTMTKIARGGVKKAKPVRPVK